MEQKKKTCMKYNFCPRETNKTHSPRGLTYPQLPNWSTMKKRKKMLYTLKMMPTNRTNIILLILHKHFFIDLAQCLSDIIYPKPAPSSKESTTPCLEFQGYWIFHNTLHIFLCMSSCTLVTEISLLKELPLNTLKGVSVQNNLLARHISL